MKVIIDCDPGVDDAYALAFVGINEDIDILAITIVDGNTNAYNAAINAKLVVDKIFPSGKPQPPIYLGSTAPFLKERVYSNFYHEDGLASTHTSLYKNETDEIKERFLKETLKMPHAAVKIVELVELYPNEVTIIALAPLTNLALALKLARDPVEFSKKIKQIVIMGGNEPEGLFESLPVDPFCNYPEFNFAVDPIATKIVFEKYFTPITIYTYEFCLRSFSFDSKLIIEEFNKYISISKRCEFLERIGIIHSSNSTSPEIFHSYDFAAMIGFLCGSRCNAKYAKLNNYSIEIINQKLAGLIVPTQNTEDIRNDNIEICFKINPDDVFQVFSSFLQKLAKLDLE